MATTANPITGYNAIGSLDKHRLREAAEILLQARRTVVPIAELPEKLRPATLVEAYFVQDAVREELGAVAGWKVGAASPEATPVFGPMYDFGITSSGALLANTMRRMRGVEAEIAFLLGDDLPPRGNPYTQNEVIAAIASAHPAIELLESAFADPDKVERLSMIADLQQHGGFVHGPAFADWRNFDFSTEQVTLSIDGVVRVPQGVNAAGPDLLHLVVWLANEAQWRTGGLRRGQWITTGSWTGKTLADPGSEIHVQFAHFGEVRATFERHGPWQPRTEPVVHHT